MVTVFWETTRIVEVSYSLDFDNGLTTAAFFTPIALPLIYVGRQDKQIWPPMSVSYSVLYFKSQVIIFQTAQSWANAGVWTNGFSCHFRKTQAKSQRNCPSFETTEVESNHRPLDRQTGAPTIRLPLPNFL